MKFLVFAENYGAKWDDKTGIHYQFPLRKYKNLITPGARFIYYQGARTQNGRQTPHYFGTGVVGTIFVDKTDAKAAYCHIVDYAPFKTPVPFKIEGQYLEDTNGRKNYFYDGAREISQACFEKILRLAELTEPDANFIERTFQAQTEEVILQGPMTVQQAMEAGSQGPVQRLKSSQMVFKRSPVVAAFVLQRADGNCERCFKPAPFLKSDGAPYLEVHHIQPLAEGGSDDISNTVAICPNCHRFLHYGQHAQEERRSLLLKIRRL